MNDLCSGCGKAPHAGGCKFPASRPTPPSEEKLQAHLAALKSPEFKREVEASLAGRNPNPPIDWKARAEAAEVEVESAWRSNNANVEALVAERARVGTLEKANDTIETQRFQEKARADALAVALAAARLEVERLTSALRRRKEGKK